MTTFDFLDDGGEIRLHGTIDPEPLTTTGGQSLAMTTDAGWQLFFGSTTFAVANPTSSEYLNVNQDGMTVQLASGQVGILTTELGQALFAWDTTGIRFFGGAPAAQPTLTSGTATPEQITLALQSLGIAGGT